MKKNRKLKEYPLHVEIETRWRDLDAFGHVNNAVFATYIETARGTLFKKWNLPFDGKGKSLIVASITINYHQQLKHPTNIIIGQKITRIGNTSFDVGSALFNNNNKEEPIATSKVTVVCFDFEKQKSIPVFKQIVEDSKL
ncbi:MAG: hypothetical protein CMG21_01945 [Candidatus Marinimicrobia bacterium]|nr:hypothetical protein [Candidatus Neomarinimicrobiota bacterium]